MEGGGLRKRNYRVCGVYSPEPRTEVYYCFELKVNISKFVYSYTVS